VGWEYPTNESYKYHQGWFDDPVLVENT